MNDDIEWIMDYQWNVMDTHGQLETLKDKLNEAVSQINWLTRELKDKKE